MPQLLVIYTCKHNRMADNKEQHAAIPFTKRMRKATAKIHNVSDALVNMVSRSTYLVQFGLFGNIYPHLPKYFFKHFLFQKKLGLTLSDDTVWKQGILTFSCVFKHLEQVMYVTTTYVN